jgi:hypothetical protein
VSPRRFLLLGLSFSTLSTAALANDLIIEDACNAECQAQKGQKIRTVNINIQPIFDTTVEGQNNWIYRLANELKFSTQEEVVRRDLIFQEGDNLEPSQLKESARILRSRRYLNGTTIDSTDNGDGTADVNVNTRDVWTTLPYLKYARGGGSSDWSFGLHDSNVLGTGKRIDLIHQKLEERSGDILRYHDPNTGWHQTSLFVRYENNSDGTVTHLNFTRPYFELTTPNSGGIDLQDIEQESILYDIGESRGRYREQLNSLEMFWGTKLDVHGNYIHRLNAGITSHDNTFFEVPGFEFGALPENWDANIVWGEYQLVQDRFIEAVNVRQMGEIEDINLGLQARARAGYTHASIDRLNNAIYIELALEKAHAFNDRNVFFTEAFFRGYETDRGTQGGFVGGAMRYHWNNFKQGQLFVSMAGEKQINGFTEQQMMLGGKSGLRGYPAYYQTGDQRYLVNIEQRYFGTKEWFSLFHLGAAVFFDQGRAWGNSLLTQSETGPLRNIGIGLRISPTRAMKSDVGRSYVMHIDLAKPLDGHPGIDNMQWLVNVRHEF